MCNQPNNNEDDFNTDLCGDCEECFEGGDKESIIKHIIKNDPTQIILSDSGFADGLLDTISKNKAGKVKWLKGDS